MNFFRMASLLFVLAVVAYTYIVKFRVRIVIGAVLLLLVTWAGILIWRKYLQLMIKKTEASLKQKLLSSEADAKEIMGLLGD